MHHDRNPSERSVIDGLMGGDPDTIAWLQRLGLIEIGSDGLWHPTALARNAVAQSHRKPDRDELLLQRGC
jgi:hypothetical protein